MRIVDVLYDDYALVYTIQTKAEVTNVVNELLSKSGFCLAQHHSGETLDVEFRICQIINQLIV